MMNLKLFSWKRCKNAVWCRTIVMVSSKECESECAKRITLYEDKCDSYSRKYTHTPEYIIVKGKKRKKFSYC